MDKFDSRKYTLALYTMVVSSVAFLLPPILTFWWKDQPLVLMGAIEYASIMTGTLALYFGANVAAKYATKTSPLLMEEATTDAEVKLPTGEK
jgi:hypothetical protein